MSIGAAIVLCICALWVGTVLGEIFKPWGLK